MNEEDPEVELVKPLKRVEAEGKAEAGAGGSGDSSDAELDALLDGMQA